MFLREVKPNYIHEDFLTAFMALPNSYFAPKAPERFQEFISRFGTHYVHAAKFGGELTIMKEKKMITGMSIRDMKEDVQVEGINFFKPIFFNLMVSRYRFILPV